MSKAKSAVTSTTKNNAGPGLTLVGAKQSPDCDRQAARKERAAALLQKLMFERELYPEFTAHLEPTIEALKTEVRRTPKSARERILLMLEPVFGLTFEELEEDLRIPADELWEVLKGMASTQPVALHGGARAAFRATKGL